MDGFGADFCGVPPIALVAVSADPRLVNPFTLDGVVDFTVAVFGPDGCFPTGAVVPFGRCPPNTTDFFGACFAMTRESHVHDPCNEMLAQLREENARLKAQAHEVCHYCRGQGVFGSTSHGRGPGGQMMTNCPECEGTGLGIVAELRQRLERAHMDLAVVEAQVAELVAVAEGGQT